MKKTSEIFGFIALLLLGSSVIIDSLSVILAFAAVIPAMLCFLSLCAPAEEKKEAVAEANEIILYKAEKPKYDWIEDTFSPVWNRVVSRKRNTEWLEKTFGNLFLRLAEDNTPR